MPAGGPPEIQDETPARIRSAFDGLRVTGALVGLLLLVAVGVWGNATSAGLNRDLVRLVDSLPRLITGSFEALGGLCAFAGPVIVVVLLVVQSRLRQVVEGLAVGTGTVAVVALFDLGLSHLSDTALHRSLTLSTASGTQPLDGYLAAWTALLISTGVVLGGVLRGVEIVAFVGYVAAELGSAQVSALSAAVSIVIGATVALGVRYLLGALNERTPAVTIAAVLATHGLDLARVERLPGAPEQRTYRAVDRGGRVLRLEVLDLDSVTSGWLYRVYRVVRLQGDLTAAPALSIDRVAERRILLGLAAARSGACVPSLVGGYAVDERANVVVYEPIDATPLADLGRPVDDAEVVDLWRNAEALHREGVSHPRLTPHEVRVADPGRVVLPILRDGSAIAGTVRINLDRAQVLVTTALLTTPERAVRLARTALDDEQLVGASTVLQPIALTRELRRSVKQHPALLSDLRAEVLRVTHTRDGAAEAAEAAAVPRIERVRPRTVIAIVGLIVAAWLLIGQLGSVNLAHVFATAKWRWVPLLLVASAASYVAAAVSLAGFVRERLSLWRTTLVQLASSFAGFVLPPALGPLSVNLRYLHRVGLPTAAAAAAVGTNQVVNGALHALLLAGVAAATGSQADHGPAVPSWAFFALGGIAALLLAALAVPRIRRWLLDRVAVAAHDVGPRLFELVSRPEKLGQAIGGSLLLNATYIAALWFAVRAFNGHAAILTVAVIYLAGAAVGSLAPTPGGIGAVEVALSTGLATAGMPGAAAVSAVLLYRIGTFWLPVPFGWVALHELQRREVL